MPANSARAPPKSLHLRAAPLIRSRSDRGSLCVVSQCHLTVNICHLRIYISCYYLLGLGLRAVSLRVLDFRQRELSTEEGSSRNHGGVLAAGVLYNRHPKWLRFCSTQRNEEYHTTSIFTRCVCCRLLMFLL